MTSVSARRSLSAAAVALACAAALLAAPPEPAAAEGCLPAGDGSLDVPEPEPAEGRFVVRGRGNGHGSGLSQHGAQGAALLGCDHATILSTYYPGTELADAAEETIDVGIEPDAPGEQISRVVVEAGGAEIVWTHGDGELTMPAGTRWRVSRDGEGLAVEVDGDGGWTAIEDAPDTLDELQAPASPDAPVTVAGDEQARGEIRLQTIGDEHIAAGVRLGLEDYLHGIAEMPASWQVEALRAQAVAARTYALDTLGARRANCECHVYDTVASQVYDGEEADERWIAAVTDTAGRIVTHDGQPITAMYSASHGGHSAAREHATGATEFPYLAAVDDSRWEAASSSDAWGVSSASGTVRDWSVSLDPVEVGQRLGVGTLVSLEPGAPDSATGWFGGQSSGDVLQAVGTDGERTLTGRDARTELRLPSARFRVAGPPATVPAPRFEGQNRYETAAKVAASRFDADTETVFVANGEGFADALSAGAAAAHEDAALLLTRTDELPEATASALEELAPERIRIVGGDVAIAPTVEDALDDVADVERLSGPDRYATAIAVADAVFGDYPTMTVASGADYPDALAGGALAAARSQPMLLVEPDGVPDALASALTDQEAQAATILGGTGAVSSAAAAELEALVSGQVDRIFGEDRVETGVRIAEALPSDADTAYLATARNHADALAAVPVAADDGAPVLLLEPSGGDDNDVVGAHLQGLAIEALHVLGGTGALPDAVVDAAQRAAAG